MTSAKQSESILDDISNPDMVLMTLRKPTDLKRVIDSIPKPIRSVPKNGLPKWYKMGLECKLPVPKMPTGKVVFSRGRIGEDVRRIGLGPLPSGDIFQPSFDLTDPYCHDVSYEYVAEHDPHLANHFSQKPARNRMKQLGLVTKDGRAICSLKAFNQYRKYLYNQFMDRIHVEIKKLDVLARDNLTMKRVEVDMERRRLMFTKEERAREHMEKVSRTHADEWAEKKRLAKEQEKKAQARIRYLAEFKERQRKERASKSHEKETRIKQRVQAAGEMELRRKITMVRNWRINEKKRLNRLKYEKEMKTRRMEDEANDKWRERIRLQNQKLLEEAVLLKMYSDDMEASAIRRAKNSEIQAYNADLQLQRLRLTNWKLLHGGKAKERALVRKMAEEFEKSKRGAKGMSPELAKRLAVECMATAMSNIGDPLMTLGQARAKMDQETILPNAVLRLIDEVLELAIKEFTRRRVTLLLRNIEQSVRCKAALVFFEQIRPSQKKSTDKKPRWQGQVTEELTRHFDNMNRTTALTFLGEVESIGPDSTTDLEMKSAKDRPPTPVPSKTKLAEVTFSDKVEDLPDPVPVPAELYERKKILDILHSASKLLTRFVHSKVDKGLDIATGKVTLPHTRYRMEWGEAVEGLSSAVVDSRVDVDCPEVRRTSDFLAQRILRSLLAEMKDEKQKMKKIIKAMSVVASPKPSGGVVVEQPPPVKPQP